MTTEETPEETTVSDQGTVTIPASLRRRLDIEPGDTLRWTVDEEEPWRSRSSGSGTAHLRTSSRF